MSKATKKIIMVIEKHNQGQFETLKIDMRETIKIYNRGGARIKVYVKIGRKTERIGSIEMKKLKDKLAREND